MKKLAVLLLLLFPAVCSAGPPGYSVAPNKYNGINTVAVDATAPIIIVPFHTEVAESALSITAAKDDRTITVVSGTGFAVGQYLSIYSSASSRWYHGAVLGVAANVITLDTPIDFEYQAGDPVGVGSTDMVVDGSVTPVSFKIRAPDPGINLEGHITRIIINIVTTSEPDWEGFGDIAALTNGIVLRKIDGSYQNIFNVKTNADLGAVTYDVVFLDGVKNGAYGINSRLTFAGPDKMGVAIEIGQGDDLEIIIQDNIALGGTILSMKVHAEGHINFY